MSQAVKSKSYIDLVLDEIEEEFPNDFFVCGIPAKQTRIIVNAMAERGWWGAQDPPVPSEAIGIDKALTQSSETGQLGIVVINSPGALLSVRSIISALHLDITGRKGKVLILTGSDSCGYLGSTDYRMQPQHASGADLVANLVGDKLSCYANIVFCPEDAQGVMRSAMRFLKQGKGSTAFVALPPQIGSVLGNISCDAEDPRQHENLSPENLLRQVEDAKNPLVYVCGGDVEALEEIKKQALPHVLGISARAHTGYDHAGCYGGIGFAGHTSGQNALSTADLVMIVGWIGKEFDDALGGCLPDAKVVYVTDKIFDPLLMQAQRLGYMCSVEKWQLLFEEIKKRLANTNNISTELAMIPQSNFESGVSPALLTRKLDIILPEGTMIFADSGNAMSVTPHNISRHPVSTDISNGCMGHSLGQGLGWGQAHPEQIFVNIIGDGSFQMNTNILPYMTNTNARGIMIVFNDGQLGMVRSGQDGHGDPNVATDLSVQGKRVNFAGIAESCHVPFVRTIETNDQVDQVLAELMSHMQSGRGPAFIDVRVDQREVPPMAARIDK